MINGVNLGPINKNTVDDAHSDTSKIRIVRPTHVNQDPSTSSPMNLVPRTTNNRQNSKETGKLLMLKNF